MSHRQEGGVAMGERNAAGGLYSPPASSTASTSYGGKRWLMPQSSSPPNPNRASVSGSTRSPVMIQGSTTSAIVALENIEQDARLKIGNSPRYASQNMLPGCAGAPKRTISAPAVSRARNVGSSGSIVLPPA